MGSNSATLIVFVLTLISVSVSLLLSSKNIFNQYKKKTGRVFEFKNIFFAAVGRLMTGIYFVIACLTAAIIYFDLDIKKMRVFGFGDAENSSLNSRFEILSQWGGEQLTYAPILGNVNVAYLVTGDAGLTLHNFFPNIQASLGLIGSTIVLMIFFQVFKSVYSEATKKYNTASVDGFVKSSIAFYSILVILFTLIIANLSSGFSWPVMWFVVGFLSNSLSIPSRSSIIN
jgi:hypothetical protein